LQYQIEKVKAYVLYRKDFIMRSDPFVAFISLYLILSIVYILPNFSITKIFVASAILLLYFLMIVLANIRVKKKFEHQILLYGISSVPISLMCLLTALNLLKIGKWSEWLMLFSLICYFIVIVCYFLIVSSNVKKGLYLKNGKKASYVSTGSLTFFSVCAMALTRMCFGNINNNWKMLLMSIACLALSIVFLTFIQFLLKYYYIRKYKIES
jgi:hypothetical protein